MSGDVAYRARSSHELIDLWRLGDQLAAAELFHRYAQRLCDLARGKMSDQLRQRVDEDDVVQSVFRTFFRRTLEGQYCIDDSGALFRLLVKIALNKIRHEAERHHAQKRDLSVQVSLQSDDFDPQAIARGPSPEEAAVVCDELEAILRGLKAPEAGIVGMMLEGKPSVEIAAQAGCSLSTVRRVRARVLALLHRRFQEFSRR